MFGGARASHADFRTVKPPDGNWKFSCSADAFAELRNDREFTFLVAISRITNALKFGMAAMNDQGKEPTPRADRQRMNAFLYVAGVLHEAFEFLDSTKSEAGQTTHAAAKGVLDAAMNDPTIVDTLRAIRNRAAFHFDPTIAGRVLPTLPVESFSFATGVGARRLDINNELSDLITFVFLFGSVNDLHAIAARFDHVRQAVYSLAAELVETLDDVTLSRLRQRGFRFELATCDESDAATERSEKSGYLRGARRPAGSPIQDAGYHLPVTEPIHYAQRTEEMLAEM